MFEALTVRPAARKIWIAGPAAVAFHAAVIAGFISASLLNTGEIGPPIVPAAIFIPIRDLPPSPPAGDGRGDTHRIRSTPLEMVQATRTAPIPVNPRTPLPAIGQGPGADGPTEAGSESGSGNGGSAEGIPGGLGDSPTATGDGPISANAPRVVAPRIVSQPQPEYPEVSRIGREEGIVVLQAIIGLDGRVENVSILRGASARLDAAAVRAVTQWRYTPATLDGRAVRVFLTATVTFRIR